MDSIYRVMHEFAASSLDRRPVATRDRKWAQAAARWLALHHISPNSISIAGMCACLAAGVVLAATSLAFYHIEWLAAALLVQLRLVANMLDGMVALAFGRPSKTGELYNEIPDRVSDAATFIGAGFASGGSITLGYLATFLAIFTAYVRAAGKSVGAPNEFCGPMAKQHRMLVITLVCLYSAAAPRSWQVVHFAEMQIGPIGIGLAIIIAGCVITIFRRLMRIALVLR